MDIIVQGKGIEFYKPNQVILNLNFYVKTKSYDEALNEGVRSVQTFVDEILLKNNFSKEEMKTRSYLIKEESRYDSETRKSYLDGFSFSQNATLKFDYSKEMLANIMVLISKLPNPPKCIVNFGIKEMKECKRAVLKNAYMDAEEQANAIALAAGKTLKECVKVDFKPFTTEYVSNSNFMENRMFAKAAGMSEQQMIMNTFTPEDIEVSETLYCLWIAE